MQIDELPAGEQTQNPDLDMNQVVGTHDILMLCFDTLRYDVSKEEEEAGRTPDLYTPTDRKRKSGFISKSCHGCTDSSKQAALGFRGSG